MNMRHDRTRRRCSACFPTCQSTFPWMALPGFRSILHSAISILHSPNPYCTAVFCTVLRNQIFPPSSSSKQIRNQKPEIRNCAESTFCSGDRRRRRPILHSAISTLHSQNPYCTAHFCTVPRNRIFFAASAVNIIPRSHLCGLCALGVLCVIVFLSLPHVAMSQRRHVTWSSNPYWTALFCAVPPNRIFLGALDSKKIRDQKSKIRNTFPSQPFLTLFNRAQVLEIPLFTGFSRKLFKKASIAWQSTFVPSALGLLCPAILTRHLRKAYCTALFCTVPRNVIFPAVNISTLFSEISDQKSETRNIPGSTFLRPLTPNLACLSPGAALITHDSSPITTRAILHSQNPYCTAVFCTVPPSEIFLRALRSRQISDQKSETKNSSSLLSRRNYLQRPTATTFPSRPSPPLFRCSSPKKHNQFRNPLKTNKYSLILCLSR
jgi:hypothetical protein